MTGFNQFLNKLHGVLDVHIVVAGPMYQEQATF